MATTISNLTRDHVVAVAASAVVPGFAAKQWRYFLLQHGQTTAQFSSINPDPDCFCVYGKTSKLVKTVWFGTTSSDTWRIHNGTEVRVENPNGTLELKKTGGMVDPHRCTGSWPLCKDGTLSRTAAGLEFPARLATTASHSNVARLPAADDPLDANTRVALAGSTWEVTFTARGESWLYAFDKDCKVSWTDTKGTNPGGGGECFLDRAMNRLVIFWPSGTSEEWQLPVSAALTGEEVASTATAATPLTARKRP